MFLQPWRNPQIKVPFWFHFNGKKVSPAGGLHWIDHGHPCDPGCRSLAPSGYVNSLLLKMAIEIVDFPIENGDFPSFFVCLAEGNWGDNHITGIVSGKVARKADPPSLKSWKYPLVMTNIAMENGPFIDDFPINTPIYKGFSMAMLVITRW